MTSDWNQSSAYLASKQMEEVFWQWRCPYVLATSSKGCRKSQSFMIEDILKDDSEKYEGFQDVLPSVTRKFLHLEIYL